MMTLLAGGKYGGGMMGGYNVYPSFGTIMGVATWIALLAFLVLGCVYFWREIQKKK